MNIIWQLVVDWLEKNSEDDLEDFYERVEFFTDNTGTWWAMLTANIFFLINPAFRDLEWATVILAV